MRVYKEDSDETSTNMSHISSECKSRAESVVEHLKTARLVNDSEFADWMVQQRQRYKPKSKVAIMGELSKAGVRGSTATDALESYDDSAACRREASRAYRIGRRSLESLT